MGNKNINKILRGFLRFFTYFYFLVKGNENIDFVMIDEMRKERLKKLNGESKKSNK